MWSDQQWGLCIFDDVIEYTGPRALEYQVSLFQHVRLFQHVSFFQQVQPVSHFWPL